MNRTKTLLAISLSLGITVATAKENVGITGGRVKAPAATSAACTPATAKADLSINNVRAQIMNGGDMWWDQGLEVARYEVPKGSGKHSYFASALWVGGLDQGGQLRTAAQTYRQTGNDFWPGALDITNASIDGTGCSKWDKLFQIYRQEVLDFTAYLATPSDFPGYTIPQSIINYPGNGEVSLNEDQFMAPFADVNGDGLYRPEDGDYPKYDIYNTATIGGGCDNYLFGDQTLWWVFNDKGNIHSESGGQPMGLEIRVQAFAFATNDEVNDMTFYQYQVINRSNLTLQQTYFGSWNDPDLGVASDDFIGCDVENGLGFCYNSTDQDGSGSGNTYGDKPPCAAVDFFKGPLIDPDGIDNPLSETFSGTGFGDGIIDNERFGMENYMIYKNDQSVEGNPSQATHFYNYLQSKWKDGTPLTYGGSGKGGTVTCRFGFPWTTDDLNANVNWECTEQADWRFIHSAGPFTLKPGAVNWVTTGCVWAQAQSGGAKASVELVRIADKKAQALFDNCFKVLEGPRAPELTIQELNRELLLYISNPTSATFNNRFERYEELDPLIPAIPGNDRTYNFEGYLIYQVRDANITASEGDLSDPLKARLAAQCDIKNEHGSLINYNFVPSLNSNIPILKNPTLNGYNKGIKHSFKITEDKFAPGSDKTLVNHKTYYFLAVAYGANNFKAYNQTDPGALDGQKYPFISGAKNSKGQAIASVSGIPHISSPQNGGTTVQCGFGDGPMLKRIEGQGNGNRILDLTEESVNQILADGKMTNPVYQHGKGPIDIKVIDPLNVPNAEFEFKLIADIDKVTDIDIAKWTLTNKTTGETVKSDTTIVYNNEQLIVDWGLSVTVQQTIAPGVDMVNNQNGVLESTIEFKDPTKTWLYGFPDQDGQTALNWIRSGTQIYSNPDPGPPQYVGNDYIGLDDKEFYEKVLEGSFAPYILAASEYAGLAWSNSYFNPPGRKKEILKNLSSVDIVITSDKTKWTRCPVLEMSDDPNLAEGAAVKFDLRKGASKDKEGNDDGTGTGMSWFPGYAINVETGERLNMAFGEDSWLIGDNGRDMIWNPTSTLFDNFFNPVTGLKMGGKHYVYVFGHSANTSSDMQSYDEGNFIKTKLSSGQVVDKQKVFKDCMWTGIPILVPNAKLLDTDVKLRLRVARPYSRFYSGNPYINNPAPPPLGLIADPNAPKADTPQNNNNPMYTFSSADLATIKGGAEVAKNALDLINVVPNPYFSYSAYESSTLDNLVKITNLPQNCVISIYTVNGTLIRKFQKDDPKTSLDWDLKNQKNVPIASGLYLIHVNVPNVGEKVVKFFGTLRPIDLDQF